MREDSSAIAAATIVGIAAHASAALDSAAAVDALFLQEARARTVEQPSGPGSPALTPGAPGAPGVPGAPHDAAGLPDASAPARPKFGARDSLRLDVEGDWIYDFADADELQARIGVAWFAFENVELAMYLTGGYAWQPGTDAGTYGLDLELRWHFLAFESWSLFGSIGGGVMGSTVSVPSDGSPFNFTPSLGGGMTVEVAADTRLYLSARWFHISNGGTYAANPGRDNLSLWAGLSFSL